MVIQNLMLRVAMARASNNIAAPTATTSTSINAVNSLSFVMMSTTIVTVRSTTTQDQSPGTQTTTQIYLGTSSEAQKNPARPSRASPSRHGIARMAMTHDIRGKSNSVMMWTTTVTAWWMSQ